MPAESLPAPPAPWSRPPARGPARLVDSPGSCPTTPRLRPVPAARPGRAPGRQAPEVAVVRAGVAAGAVAAPAGAAVLVPAGPPPPRRGTARARGAAHKADRRARDAPRGRARTRPAATAAEAGPGAAEVVEAEAADEAVDGDLPGRVAAGSGRVASAGVRAGRRRAAR